MADATDLAKRLRPGLDEARALAGEANVIPVALTVTEDCETPVSALLKLRGEGPCFLLESAERGQVGRYSFVGVEPRAVLRWVDGELREYPGDAGATSGDPTEVIPAPDPYAAIASYMERFEVAEVPDLPPFAGGAVGIFGYDLVRTVESLGEPNPDPLDLPDLALLVTDALIAFDHLHNRMTILACAFVEDGDVDRAWKEAADRIASLRERLAAPVPTGEAAQVEPAEPT